MSVGSVPPRPPVPAAPPRPPVPQVASRPPVPTPTPAPVVPVAPQAPVVPVAEAPAPVPTPVVPVVETPVVPVVSVVSVAEVAPKKRGRKAGDGKGRAAKITTPWSGIYALTADGTDYVYDKVAKADGTGDEMKPRIQRLKSVPALVVKTKDEHGNEVSDGGFDPDKHDRLTPRSFEKPGDYFRFEAALAHLRADQLLQKAADADAGKLRASRANDKQADELKKLHAILAARFSPEEIAAMIATVKV